MTVAGESCLRLKVFCLVTKRKVRKSRIRPGILLQERFSAIESRQRLGRRIEDTIRDKERSGVIQVKPGTS